VRQHVVVHHPERGVRTLNHALVEGPQDAVLEVGTGMRRNDSRALRVSDFVEADPDDVALDLVEVGPVSGVV
jgi:hypothetical protein